MVFILSFEVSNNHRAMAAPDIARWLRDGFNPENVDLNPVITMWCSLHVAPVRAPGVVRIDPFHFLAGCRKKATKPGSVCPVS